MLACTNSCATVGLEGYIIRVEVDLSPGVPKFNMVGLPDTAVQEAVSEFAPRSATVAATSQCAASQSTSHPPT